MHLDALKTTFLGTVAVLSCAAFAIMGFVLYGASIVHEIREERVNSVGDIGTALPVDASAAPNGVSGSSSIAA